MKPLEKLQTDEEMLIRLIESHKNQFYRIAFAYVKNEQDALDVIQESVYKAYISLNQLKSPKYFKSWFIRILINKSVDQLAKNRKVVPLLPELTELIEAPDHKISDHDRLEMSLDLAGMLDHLNPSERMVVTLRFYEDYSLKEISEMMNKPLSSVKSTLYRSIDKLKEFF